MNINLKKIRPLRGKLLGEILGGDYQTESGIYVVTGKKSKKPRSVKIVAVGAPYENERSEPQEYRAKPGDVAFFKLAEGKKLEIKRKKYLMLENEDIVAVETNG